MHRALFLLIFGTWGALLGSGCSTSPAAAARQDARVVSAARGRAVWSSIAMEELPPEIAAVAEGERNRGNPDGAVYLHAQPVKVCAFRNQYGEHRVAWMLLEGAGVYYRWEWVDLFPDGTLIRARPRRGIITEAPASPEGLEGW